MANQYTKQINWEEVFEKYNPNIYTSKEIAAILDVHPSTVRRNKSKYNYPSKKEFWKRVIKDYPPDAYSCEEIAKELRIDLSTVCKAYKRYMRGPGSLKRRRKPRIMSVKYILEKKGV